MPRRGGASARPSGTEARALRDAAYAAEGDSSAGPGLLAGASALFLAAAAVAVTLPVGELGTQAVRWPSAAAPVYQAHQRYEVARPQPIRHLPPRAAVYAAASRTAPHPVAAPKRLAARTQSVAQVRRAMPPPPVVFAPPPPPVAAPVAIVPMPAAEVVRSAFPFSPDAPATPCAPAMAGYAVAAAVMVAGMRGGAADAASAPAMAVSAEALSVAAAAWATAVEAAAAPAAEAGGAGARGNARRAAPAAAGEAPQAQAAPAAEGASPTAGKPRRKRNAPGSPGKAPRA